MPEVSHQAEFFNITPVEISPIPRAGYREVADMMVQNIELEAQVEDLQRDKQSQEEENLKILGRMSNLRFDVLLENQLTPSGFKDYLGWDPDIKADIERMNWGAVKLDVRFVNIVNKSGHATGDEFIVASGSNIEGMVEDLRMGPADRRTHSEHRDPEDERRSGQDRRKSHDEIVQEALAIAGDLTIRVGGDEFLVIIRDITPEELDKLGDWIQKQLTIEHALTQYENGEIPLIASSGVAHVTEMEDEVLESLEQEEHYDAVRHISNLADQREVDMRRVQYAEMWETVENSLPDNEKPLAEPDDRTIATMFVHQFFPNFFRAPGPYMEQAANGTDSEGK